MSNNFANIILYRHLCKNTKYANNRSMFRNWIQSNSLNENRIKYIEYYLKMKFHINKENELLESYNINIVRDNKRDIESVARKVGLQI